MRRLRSAASAAALTGFLFLAFFTPGYLHAQLDTGSVTGTIVDQTGAVIPNVAITLTNDATGVVMTTKSTATGSYFIGSVRPGTYTLQAALSGFQTSVTKGIIVNVQRTPTIDIQLKTGTVQEKVTVTAAPPLLQAESAAVGQTINSQTINNLPLQTRNWTSLPQLAAGVNAAAPGEPNGNSNGPVVNSGTSASSYYTVNGVNVWQNDYRLNGINDNIEVYGGNYTGSNAAIVPPPDAIQQFKIQSGDYSAQFGHSTGGVINAALKSGTNHFHGDLWEYIRNDAFNANNFFNRGKPVPEYRQNIFGFTFGGPIVRNKTFFFGDYQGQRYVYPSQFNSTVPTAAMRNSDFLNLQDIFLSNSGTETDALGRTFRQGTILDPATTRLIGPGAVDPVTGLRNTATSGGANPVPVAAWVRDPFYTGGSVAGITNFTNLTQDLNILPQGRVDPNAQKLLAVYPTPTVANTFSNNFQAFNKQTQDNNSYDIRIDQNFNDRNTLFAVWDQSFYSVVVPSGLPGMAVGQSGGRNDKLPAYAWAVGYNHVFSPTLTTDLHVGYVHSEKNQKSFFGNQFGIPAQFGIQGVPQVANNGGIPPFYINSLGNLGVGNYTPTIQTVWSLEGVDNVTKVWKNHTFMTGIQVDDLEGDISQPPQGRGDFHFNGQYSDIPNRGTGATGMADLLLIPQPATYPGDGGVNFVGGMSSFSGSNIGFTDDHRWYIGAYFQDDWKATPRLTLNLGLRWDFFTPYAEIHGHQANFIPSGGGNSAPGTYYMSNKGCQTPRSAGFDTLLAANNITLKCIPSLSLGEAQKTNFAPRLGFAYRVTNQIVARAGYGISYGALGNLGYGGTLGTNYPFVYVTNFNSPDSQHPLLLSNGNPATMEEAFTTVSLSDPTVNAGNGLNLYGRQWNYQTPYIQTFNLTVQDQFSNHDSIQAGYVGTLGRHLDNLGNNNQPSEILPLGTDPQKYVPFPGFSRGATFEMTNAISSYNSLQVTYEHQLSHGLSLLGNYTWAKCMTNQHTQAGQYSGYRAQWLPGFGIGADYGLCDSDVTNLVHLAGTYHLPIGTGRALLGSANRVTNAILGGWVANFIYTHQGGQPITIGCPTGTTSGFGCFAFKKPNTDLYAGPHNYTQWLNPAAFLQPPLATAPVGQNSIMSLGGLPFQARGPNYNDLDSSVLKNFAITETVNVQFRAEAFNTTNTTQFNQPGNTNQFLNVKNNFSKITSTRGNPRTMQFALKVTF